MLYNKVSNSVTLEWEKNEREGWLTLILFCFEDTFLSSCGLDYLICSHLLKWCGNFIISFYLTSLHFNPFSVFTFHLSSYFGSVVHTKWIMNVLITWLSYAIPMKMLFSMECINHCACFSVYSCPAGWALCCPSCASPAIHARWPWTIQALWRWFQFHFHPLMPAHPSTKMTLLPGSGIDSFPPDCNSNSMLHHSMEVQH